LIYSLLFFLPTQLGRHFWFDWSSKLGQRVDYLSPTVYFTDLIILLTLIVYSIKSIKTKNLKLKAENKILNLKSFLKVYKLLVFSFLLLVVSYWLLFIKENPYLLAYNLAKLVEFVLLGVVIAKTFTRIDLPKIISVLNLSLLVQVGLAFYQVVVEKSLGLWIIGERNFGIYTPGIAKFTSFSGHQLLRGYGTFPHPNVLAGFCLLLLVANTFLFLGRRRNENITIYVFGFILSLLGIWLSLSVLAIVLSQVFLLFLLLKYFKSLKKIFLIFSPILIFGVFVFRFPNYQLPFTNYLASESVSRRVTLSGISWNMFKKSPIFGVGLGNFIPSMPEAPIGKTYFWQPVHNVIALILAETGLVGGVVIGWLFWKLVARFMIYDLRIKSRIFLNLKSYILILASWWLVILATGLFDHYWLTLQQGRLMLTVVASLSFLRAVSEK